MLCLVRNSSIPHCTAGFQTRAAETIVALLFNVPSRLTPDVTQKTAQTGIRTALHKHNRSEAGDKYYINQTSVKKETWREELRAVSTHGDTWEVGHTAGTLRIPAMTALTEACGHSALSKLRGVATQEAATSSQAAGSTVERILVKQAAPQAPSLPFALGQTLLLLFHTHCCLR